MVRLPNTQWRHLSILDHGPRSKTTCVVIHCIEGSAPGAVDFFANGTGGNPGVGAHLVMGLTPATSWQLTDLDNKCWHAVGANDMAPGIEHEGSSTDSRATWLKRYNMLNRSAARLAWMCHQYKLGVPQRHKNVFAHSDGGVAWGNHGDPGPNFPWTIYLGLAKAHYLSHWGRR